MGVIDGGIAIFAAGNEYAPMVSYPGAYGDFICVTALDPAGKPSCYTNYVSQVEAEPDCSSWW